MARSPRRRHPRVAGLLVCFAALLAPAAANGQPAAANTAELQGLIEDLGFQLRMVYRGRPAEFAERYELLRGVLNAWNASSKSAANAAEMDRWLHAAIRATMPGARGGMPAAPDFTAAQPIAAQPLAERLPKPIPGASSRRSVSPPMEPRPLVSSTENSADATRDPALAATPAPAINAQRDLAAGRAAAGRAEPSLLDQMFPEETPAEATAASEVPARERGPATSPAVAAHPAAADLVWGDPFADDPLPAAEPPLTETTRMKPVAAGGDAVQVNRAELTARLRALRLRLGQIEAELIASPQASGFRLAGWARDLAKLEGQIATAGLYTQFVPKELGEPLSLPATRPVRDLLASRIATRSAGVAAEASRSSQAERAMLEEASVLLAAGSGG